MPEPLSPRIVRNSPERIESETLRALQATDVRARLEDTGMTITAMREPQFVEFIQADIRKWTPVIKAA